MNDFVAEPEELQRAELAAAERVFQSGVFILGREVQQFEQDWAGFCGAKCCVGVANGTEAIELGLRALDIGPGDEVITTSMTAIATVLAIIHAGATPVFADIDPATVLLESAAAERQLSPKTKAVLLVHLYGQMPDMQRWVELCRQTNIHLLEDCAQSHGAAWDGRHAGTFGTWGAFSFYPTKNLGARGDAGALVTNSQEIADRVKALRNCGMHDGREAAEPALNSRLDELQAAILSVRLKWLHRFNARRQEIARTYIAGLVNPKVELLSAPSHSENHVYHLFVVRSDERDRLAEFLKAKGVQTLVHYPLPAHRHSFHDRMKFTSTELGNAENHARQCLSLPCHPQLGAGGVARVIEAINQFS
ncbi:MAG TPA: DegT/DnrJ/EryC1/StrS family aminotransferase [Chthoniobacterales bacterium]